MIDIRSLVVTLAAVLVTSLLSLLVLSKYEEEAMTEKQVKADVERQYDVRVLNILSGKDNGRAVYFVKVMYNGGDWNTAFQVNTFVLDHQTGKRVSQFKHHSSGRTLAKNRDVTPNRQPPDALRKHIWR